MENLKKDGGNMKKWSMTKKRLSEILGVKMKIFSLKNLIQKSWSAKFVSAPQTRRQVSAYANWPFPFSHSKGRRIISRVFSCFSLQLHLETWFNWVIYRISV